MQFKNRNTKNYLKLKKLLRNNTRCIICDSRLSQTGVLILNRRVKDTEGVKCIECVTIYDSNLNIKKLGIVRRFGEA